MIGSNLFDLKSIYQSMRSRDTTPYDKDIQELLKLMESSISSPTLQAGDSRMIKFENAWRAIYPGCIKWFFRNKHKVLEKRYPDLNDREINTLIFKYELMKKYPEKVEWIIDHLFHYWAEGYYYPTYGDKRYKLEIDLSKPIVESQGMFGGHRRQKENQFLILRCRKLPALPLTETGYKSHFAPHGEIDAGDSAVQYVLDALTKAEQSLEWKRYLAASQQLSFFK